MLVLSTSVCDRVMSAVPVGLRGALFALSAFGCGSEGAGVQRGHLSLPLSTEAAGATYRLSGASFDLAGPESRLLESDDDEDLLIAALAAGDYEIELLEGWELQKLDGAESEPHARRQRFARQPQRLDFDVEIVSDLFVTSNRSLPSCEADALLGRLIFVPEFVRIEDNAEASCE